MTDPSPHAHATPVIAKTIGGRASPPTTAARRTARNGLEGLSRTYGLAIGRSTAGGTGATASPYVTPRWTATPTPAPLSAEAEAHWFVEDVIDCSGSTVLRNDPIPIIEKAKPHSREMLEVFYSEVREEFSGYFINCIAFAWAQVERGDSDR